MLAQLFHYTKIPLPRTQTNRHTAIQSYLLHSHDLFAWNMRTPYIQRVFSPYASTTISLCKILQSPHYSCIILTSWGPNHFNKESTGLFYIYKKGFHIFVDERINICTYVGNEQLRASNLSLPAEGRTLAATLTTPCLALLLSCYRDGNSCTLTRGCWGGITCTWMIVQVVASSSDTWLSWISKSQIKCGVQVLC
jgi:hypothetical protein